MGPSEILDKCIAILDKEIDLISSKQTKEGLTKPEFDRIIDSIKALTVTQREKRSEKEDNSELKTDEELEAAILAEAEEIKRRKGL